ncbi:MAG TPA: YceI family protein [Chitinophagaceae bacterium]|nr:YceI family protein [Chitinophagaceae bacterium]
MATTHWLVDPAHSEVQFKVKHLMITTVTGYFRKFNLQVDTEGTDFTRASKILFTAEIDSVDTNTAQRDTHLKSNDFFAADQYPQLKFEGKKYEKSGDRYTLQGDLTIRNITKPVKLDVEYAGMVTDPYGQTKAGFTVDGKIKRKDFELMWDAVTEAGQVVVSNDVRIHAEVQLIRQEDKASAVASPADKVEVIGSE